MNAGRKSGHARDRSHGDGLQHRGVRTVPGIGADFPLGPFQECTAAIGSDPVLTGYIDNYLPEVEADRHAVRVTGRSKTEDIVDCTPDIAGGQFAGYKLDAIARAIAGLFKIDVVVQTDVGEPFPDATIERHETGFAFLERLCRLRSVLATDDEQGRLVLTRAGSDRAHDALLQGPGGNVQWASAVITGSSPVTSLRRTVVQRLRKRRGHHGNAYKSRAGTNRDGVGKAGSEASYKVE